MDNATRTDATQILKEWSEGDKDAPARLMPLIYEELRQRAAEYLRHERPDHTLQATALVHEAYLKLVDQNRATWKDRAHFASVAARSEEHTSELQSQFHLVCRLLLEKKKNDSHVVC